MSAVALLYVGTNAGEFLTPTELERDTSGLTHAQLYESILSLVNVGISIMNNQRSGEPQESCPQSEEEPEDEEPSTFRSPSLSER